MSKETRFIKCYISGYLNMYYFYYDVAYDPKKETFLHYKIQTVLHYAGFEKVSVDLSRIASLLSVLESLFGSVYVFAKFLYVFLWHLFVQRRNYNDKTFLASLTFAPFRLKGFLEAIRPIEVSTIKIPFIKNGYKENEINILSSLNSMDIVQSLLLSWRTIWLQYYKYRHRDTLFRSYSCFEYYLACYFVDHTKESNQFVFYNTYDRWAFLMSATPNSTFIQHGKLMDTLRLIKISTPARAYYINQVQQKVCENVLYRGRPRFIGFRKHLEFTCNDLLKSNGKKNVLIVCWNNNITQEWEICRILDKKVNIYLKPHPGDKDNPSYPQMAKQYDGVIIPKTGYPKVDVVLSYDSTLADEYEDVGIYVIRYDLLKNLSEIASLL